MGLYPLNPAMGQTIQTHAPGEHQDLGWLAHVAWAAPAAAAAASVLASTALANGAVTTVTAGITDPDCPRALSVTGNQATVAGNVVITGTNDAGEAITETIVAAGVGTIPGTKAFKTVIQIELPPRAAAGDAISVGVTDLLGLPYRLAHDTVLLAFLNHAREAVLPTVAVDSAHIEGNTCDLNSALTGDPVDVYLVV